MKSIVTFLLILVVNTCIYAVSLDLRKAENYGVIFSEEKVFIPNENGILSDLEIKLPDYQEGIFTSCDNTYNGNLPPSHINRSLPWYFTPESLTDLITKPAYSIAYDKDKRHITNSAFNIPKNKRMINPNGVFLVIRLKDGRSMALLPMANPLSVCFILIDQEKGFCLRHAIYGKNSFSGKVPLLAWATGKTPTEASYKLFENLSKEKNIRKSFNLRYQKSYPEPFKYLGWCSWEEYHTNISESLLVKAAQDLKKSEVPVRFMLIDDGHQERTNVKVGNKTNRTLTSFRTDPKLFPNGYDAIIAERDTSSLKWFGLWLNMHGYWQGFTEKNNGFGNLNKYLREIPSNGFYMPKNDSESIVRLYQNYFEPSIKAGFDFLKIDWQTSGMMLTSGTENPAQQAWQTSRTVDSLTAKQYHYTIMNCMAQNNVVLLNTLNSNSTRVSIDYKLNNLPMAKEHILQSFQNAVYMCPTVWGDHDMFHSSDSVSGEIMALSKALSGGPIYLSDAPDKILQKNVEPLCFSNGRLLRPLAPGTTLPKSYFSSPYNSPDLFYVAAPLKNEAVAIVAYNLYNESFTLEGKISATDYLDAFQTIQGQPIPSEIPSEGIFAYNFFKQEGLVLGKGISFTIKDFNHCYYQLSPIRKGWSVIGAIQKYLCSEAVENIVYTNKILSFDLIEGGEFAIYLSKGKPKAENCTFVALGSGLWKGHVAPVKNEQRINIKIRQIP